MDESDRQLLLDVFSTESFELLDTFEQGVLDLEQDPTDAETVGALFRAMHTLKGNAVVVGFGHVAALAHVIEDALERVAGASEAVTPQLIALWLDGADAMRESLTAALAGREAPSPVVARFEAFLARGSAPQSVTRAPGGPAGGEASQAARFHRVSADKLDRILDLMGELTVARSRVGALLERPDATIPVVREAHRDAEQLALTLQDALLGLRMVPVGTLFRPHARTVRELARATHKQARLVVEGAEVEIDATVAEAVRDPLMHMLRNAVDHGLELPADREAKGKDPVGKVTLRAWHEPGRVMVSVGDDGGGLDRPKILARARQLGLAGASDSPPDSVIDDFVFQPGFSTAAEVGDLSGRGVGMDVVRRNIEALRGSVRLVSRPGKGTEVIAALPLTLAIIEGFAVELGGQSYVLPLDAVEECVELPGEERAAGKLRGVLNLRGEPLPYLRPHERLRVEGKAHRESVVVVRCSAGRAGIVVDRILGAEQTVIKPLPPGLRHARGIAGSSLLGDGQVALIVDIEGLLFEELNAARALRAEGQREVT